MTFDCIMNKVENGSKLVVNFENKTCKLNDEYIKVDERSKESIEDVMTNIEYLYNMYYTSEPTPYDRRHTYFRAKTFEDMTDIELIDGCNRSFAMAKLELYVLQSIISGNLFWNWGNKWFWQSENNKSLIILKQWI